MKFRGDYCIIVIVVTGQTLVLTIYPHDGHTPTSDRYTVRTPGTEFRCYVSASIKSAYPSPLVRFRCFRPVARPSIPFSHASRSSWRLNPTNRNRRTTAKRTTTETTAVSSVRTSKDFFALAISDRKTAKRRRSTCYENTAKPTMWVTVIAWVLAGPRVVELVNSQLS